MIFFERRLNYQTIIITGGTDWKNVGGKLLNSGWESKT